MYADQAQVILKKFQSELPVKFVVLASQIIDKPGNFVIIGGVPNGQPGELKFVDGTNFIILCDNNSEDWVVIFIVPKQGQLDAEYENFDNMYAATDAVLKRMKNK